MSTALAIGLTIMTGIQALELPVRVTGRSIALEERVRETLRFELAIGRWPTAQETAELEALLAGSNQGELAFYRAVQDLPEIGRVLLGRGPSTPVLWAGAERRGSGWRLTVVTYQNETVRDFGERQRGRDFYALVLIEMELDRDGNGSGQAYRRARLVYDRGRGAPVLDGEYLWKVLLRVLRLTTE